MSWSVSAQGVKSAEDVQDLPTSPLDLVEGPEDQHRQAVVIVEDIIESGNVGSGPWNITMSGHFPVASGDSPTKSMSISINETPAA